MNHKPNHSWKSTCRSRFSPRIVPFRWLKAFDVFFATILPNQLALSDRLVCADKTGASQGEKATSSFHMLSDRSDRRMSAWNEEANSITHILRLGETNFIATHTCLLFANIEWRGKWRVSLVSFPFHFLSFCCPLSSLYLSITLFRSLFVYFRVIFRLLRLKPFKFMFTRADERIYLFIASKCLSQMII